MQNSGLEIVGGVTPIRDGKMAIITDSRYTTEERERRVSTQSDNITSRQSIVLCFTKKM